MARSIFSFTSMKSRLMSLPGSKVKVMTPASVRDVDSMRFSPATCESCWRIGLTICCSISRAELPCADICTTIRGTSMSGISETGIRWNASTPSVTMAINDIVTAIGRCSSVLSIIPYLFPQSSPRYHLQG